MKTFLLNFLSSRSIMNQEQFGFLQSLSTFNALTAFTENINSALDVQRTMLTIYIDFNKAFDAEKHDILLKIEHYGIQGIIHNWFKNYVAN